MILVDFSNISLSIATQHFMKKEPIDLGVLRSVILTKLFKELEYVKKFNDEVVIAIDGGNKWRKDIFPYYKASRKSTRDKDDFDWDAFFASYNILLKEFEENIPFHWLQVKGAEADDIISVLAETFGNQRKICIISSDKDFIQLQENVNSSISQWSIYHHKMINPKNSSYDLFTHIVKGDAGDGIPNILSDDDTFIDPNKRQRTIQTTKLEKWRVYGLRQPEKFCPDSRVLDNFIRNSKLIDLRLIPEEVKKEVQVAYNQSTIKKGKLFQYMVKHRMNRLMKDINI